MRAATSDNVPTVLEQCKSDPSVIEASAQASSDLFSRLDADGSGTITREEFEKAGTVEPISLQMWLPMLEGETASEEGRDSK